jgi:hypothetical protein
VSLLGHRSAAAHGVLVEHWPGAGSIIERFTPAAPTVDPSDPVWSGS